MGQTLTNGIYLPAEGERNCYDGLEGNWRSLDGLISAVGGKASASHAHGNITNDGKVGTTANLPLITGTGGAVQAGAFGNQANTFCEGNDSRLSDARTPVAHTHGKADITDLFNSANTWSNDQIIASSNDRCYCVKDTVYELGQTYSNGEYLGGLKIQDKNGVTVGLLDIVDRSYGNMEMRIRVQQKFDPNSNNRSTSGNILYNEMILGITPTKTNYLGFNADLWGGNTYNLGTASSKWKSLNGVNPGALSLPVTALNNTYDISGNITDLTGGNNAITAARTGWIFVKSDNATEISIENTTTGMGASDHSASATTLMVSIPVTSGETLNIIANCTSIDKAYLLPCQGNV